MRRKKGKAFIITKVKEKLIYLPPKKFFGKKVSGVILLVLGSIIITGCLFNFYLIPIFFPKTECPKVSTPEIKPDFPAKLVIGRLNLEIPIEQARIINNQWAISETALSYLPENSDFKDKGNLVIYGKNDQKLLGRLTEMRKKDLIVLFWEKNSSIFEVSETKTVLASDETIFTINSGRTLTLFSTVDYLKGKRFMVKAILR